MSFVFKKVFAVDSFKLFHNRFEPGNIEFEQRMAQAVHASGLPVPAAGEILRVNDRFGLVYERLDGPSRWEMLRHHP